MGQVYLALHRRMGRRVAVKLLSGRTAADAMKQVIAADVDPKSANRAKALLDRATRASSPNR